MAPRLLDAALVWGTLAAVSVAAIACLVALASQPALYRTLPGKTKTVLFIDVAVSCTIVLTNWLGNKLYGARYALYDPYSASFRVGGCTLCGWHVLHVALWTLNFAFCPLPLWFIVGGSLAWEGIEEYALPRLPGMQVVATQGAYAGAYWRGDPKDVVCNAVGGLLGRAVRLHLKVTPQSVLYAGVLYALVFISGHACYMHWRLWRTAS